MADLPPYRGGCTPGMVKRPDGQGCRAGCLHRALVSDYRDARHAWEALRESDTPVPAAYAYGSTATCAQLEDGDFRTAFPPPTFKDWLIAHARGAHEGD